MITPRFSLTQDADFVLLAIRLPNIRADEGEFYIDGHEVKFHLHPYFLRLTFRRALVEDGRERAEHDVGSGVLTVWLPKATPGEHFDDLQMVTELLRPPAPKKGPLIEVVGGDDDGDDDDDDDDFDELGIDVEQQLPPTDESSGLATGVRYGFNGAYSGVFVGDEQRELLQLSDPESADASARRAAREAAEADAFDADHYMADFMEDDGVQAALRYVPWWHRPWPPQAEEESGAAPMAAEPAALTPDQAVMMAVEDAAAATGTDVATSYAMMEQMVQEHGKEALAEKIVDDANALIAAAAAAPAAAAPEARTVAALAAPIAAEPMATEPAAAAAASSAAAAPASAAPAFGVYTTEEADQLARLPRKEYLMEAAERRRAWCGLVDVLYAYAYDERTTDGEGTVESPWTIRRLSATLSWLDPPDSVHAAALGAVRRALCYPLYRHWRLALAVVADVAALLRLGRAAVLRALLRCRATVQAAEHGYLLHRVWLDDYCVWVQQQPEERLATLADQLGALQLERDAVGWPLQAYEELAQGDGEEEDEGEGEVV